jgi:hypothetical protein
MLMIHSREFIRRKYQRLNRRQNMSWRMHYGYTRSISLFVYNTSAMGLNDHEILGFYDLWALANNQLPPILGDFGGKQISNT